MVSDTSSKTLIPHYGIVDTFQVCIILSALPSAVRAATPALCTCVITLYPAAPLVLIKQSVVERQ